MAETCSGQAMESTAMAGNSLTRAVLAEGLQMWSKSFLFITSNALLSGFCQLLFVCVVAWIWSQCVKILKRRLRKTQNVGLNEAINTEKAWKDGIERLEAEKGPKSEVHGELIHSSHGENDPLLIPVSVSVSDLKVKQKVLKKPEMADAIDVIVQPGPSSLLQSKVELNQQSVSMLHNLAVEGTMKDEKFTVQLSRWRLFLHTAGGMKMLKLDDHEVPTILRSAYAAGKLTVEGFNLEGAEIKAATFDKCIALKRLTKEELGGLQIWTSIMRLPSNNLGEVSVYATKPMCIDNHNMIVRSSVTGVQDDNLRTVLRVAIPSTIGVMYMIMIYIKLFSLDGWHFISPAFVWILPLFAMALTQILPQHTEDAIEACMERIGLATVALYFGTRSLFFKQDRELASSRIAPLPEVHSLESSDCKNQEKRMDREEKKMDRGKTHWMMEKYEKTEKSETMEKIESTTNEEPQCFAYEEYIDEHGRTMVRKRDFETEQTEPSLPFKFIYGLKDKVWNERDYFKFYSQSDLIQVFRKFLPDKFNLMGNNKVKIYASEFFHIRNEMREAQDSLVAELSATLPRAQADQLSAHLKYFWQFLDTTSEEVSNKYEAMKKECCVSWDMLWAFFPSGTRAAYRCALTGEELCGIAQSVDYSFCEQDGIPKLYISLKIWDYNCKAWRPYSDIRRAIPQYSGGRHFTSLETHPLQFKTDPEGVEKKFLAKGAWFGELCMRTRNRFMHYKGLLYTESRGEISIKRYCGEIRSTESRGEITKDAVNGRVMIGLASFAKMNPDYPLGSATPPSEILRTNEVELIDISKTEDRMFAPAIVYGFCFQTKKWGAFNIDGFEEIVFNESAYEALVMDARKKDTIYSLVHEYKRGDDLRDERVDPIVGKGEGCVLLCYGPPGTGKTFTAESISEKLHAPLWALSVSELGTTPAALEAKLVRILDVAASWGAILLLDEADVYLEKRDSGTMDLERNAMTGIFLRNLEYYKGVLFLTTNRVVAFDDAFCSRISMFLYYGKHLERDRRIIWKNLLEPLSIPDLAEFLDTDYASFELNAREIRNVVQVARTLAKTKGAELNGSYLRHSLQTLASSLLELKRITGEPQPSSFTGFRSLGQLRRRGAGGRGSGLRRVSLAAPRMSQRPATCTHPNDPASYSATTDSLDPGRSSPV